MNRSIKIQGEIEGESYAAACAVIMNDPSTSDWLKRSVLALSRRDPVDALGDASVLIMLVTQRIEELEHAADRASVATAAVIAKMQS